MRSSKVVLAAILGVIAIGVCASTASAAQEWLIDYRDLSELELTEEEFEVTSKAPTVLSSKPLGIKLVIECETTKGSGTVFSGGTNEISLELTGCKAKELPACKPAEPVVITAQSKVASTSNGFHEKIEPIESKPLAKIVLGEECVIEEALLQGELAAELPLEVTAERNVKASEAFTKKINEELKAGGLSEYKLLFANQVATLSGTFTAKWSGENAGKMIDAQPATVLCKSPPAGMGQQCPAGESWPANTVVKFESLEGEKGRWLFFGNPAVTCDALRLEGPIGAGAALTGKFESASFGASCEGGCTVSGYDFPWTYRFNRVVKNLVFLKLSFKFDCGTGKVCKYTNDLTWTTIIQGGAPAAAELSLIPFGLQAGDPWCTPVASWANSAGGSTRFKFWEPAPLYVASA